mgnify:CR=1 FL=1
MERLKTGHEEPEDLSPAADADLDLLGAWVGPAQWLYAAHELRAPHGAVLGELRTKQRQRGVPPQRRQQRFHGATQVRLHVGADVHR